MSNETAAVAVVIEKVKCGRSGVPVAKANTIEIGGVVVGKGSQVAAEKLQKETGLTGAEFAKALKEDYKLHQRKATTQGMINMGMLPTGYRPGQGIRNFHLQQQAALAPQASTEAPKVEETQESELQSVGTKEEVTTEGSKGSRKDRKKTHA